MPNELKWQETEEKASPGKADVWSREEKKQLVIFALTAFGLPVLMGILMGYSFYKGNNVSAFPNAQMYFPAMGVMLATLIVRKKREACAQ